MCCLCGPEQGSANPRRAEGLGWGPEGPGVHGSAPGCPGVCPGQGGPEPHISAGGAPSGTPGSCGKGRGERGPGTMQGPGALWKWQRWLGERRGDWHVGQWLAGWSSGRCRWSRGEAGSWRGIWLSCWTCTAGRQGVSDKQGMGTAGTGLGRAGWKHSWGRTGQNGMAGSPGGGCREPAGPVPGL